MTVVIVNPPCKRHPGWFKPRCPICDEERDQQSIEDFREKLRLSIQEALSPDSNQDTRPE